MGFLAALGVFSSLSLNLALLFGLGMRGLSVRRNGKIPVPFLETAVIFLSVLILWLFFTFILAPLKLGFFLYFLLFPLGALTCTALERFLVRFVWQPAAGGLAAWAGSLWKILQGKAENGASGRSSPSAEKRSPPLFRGISGYDGLVPLALLLTLNVGITLAEAAVLAFGFALGILLAALILNEIRRRSALEAVPHFLRGTPLTLISMGLLSLIFSSASVMFFNALRF
jgi:electron transport complex protein RnfA